MASLNEKISKLLNPVYLYRRGVSEAKYLAFSSGIYTSKNYVNLSKLKNRHQSKRAFIVGTGASLKVDDLEQIKDEITFSCNKIYLAFNQTEWRPTYYMAGDQLIFSQFLSELEQISGTTVILPLWVRYLFGPIQDAIFFKAIAEEPDIKTPRFSVDALDRLYWAATVTYTLFQLACYMGIREIYLIGVDFNYCVPKDKLIGDQPYMAKSSLSYFHPQYHRYGEMVDPPNLHLHEIAYLTAAQEMSKLGVKVYNATRGGKLEIFPRVDFDVLMEYKRPTEQID